MRLGDVQLTVDTVDVFVQSLQESAVAVFHQLHLQFRF